MKNLIFLLIPLLFLSSCTIDWNDEKDKKIVELNVKIEAQKEEIKKVKDDNLFMKKQTCLKYNDAIEKDLKDKETRNWEWNYTLEQIFYSIPKDECYFVSVNEKWKSTERWLYKYWNHSWYSKSEYSCNYYYKDDFTKVDNWCTELDAKIQELKWE